jgi:hypothetical protein
MSFVESCLVALFVMSVVFMVLCGLYIIMEIFSRVFSSVSKSKDAGGSAAGSGK